MPFGKAAGLLEAFTRVVVSEDYTQQHTEAAGAAQVALQVEAVEHLERDTPPAPMGPAKLYLSADGACVPLVGGQWGEVKTLVLGEVAAARWDAKHRDWGVRTEHLSYFSRLAEADNFRRLALVETHRRGVETAGQVGAIVDGAEWLQGFIDFHRRDAVRILDFPHAGSYVNKIGQASFGAESPELIAWRKTHLHALKHQGPDEVLVELREMVLKHPQAEVLELPKALTYLEKRTLQMQYPAFQTQGWPIGSGATESGNKLVVEARLKGAGMHWAYSNVDPMLALRNIVCNDRWDEAWPQIVTYLRQRDALKRAERRQKRRGVRLAQSTEPPPTSVVPEPPTSPNTPRVVPPIVKVPKSDGPHRPAPDHPWRLSPVGRAQYEPAKPKDTAKL
jgi:hypothetical protein